jgi:hypothetical protein
MKRLYTNHYQTQILKTKKLNLNSNTYIGFSIHDLQEVKLIKQLTLENVVEFKNKGLSFINKKNIKQSTLQFI